MVGKIAFIGALCFVVRNFATFRNLIKTKAIVDAYGYDYLLHDAQRGYYALSYRRRFPVVCFIK